MDVSAVIRIRIIVNFEAYYGFSSENVEGKRRKKIEMALQRTGGIDSTASSSHSP